MKFTLKLSDGSLLTGEIVGDGGMVSSYARAQHLIRYRIRKCEMLCIETWRDNQTGKYKRIAVKPEDVVSVMWA